MLRHVRSRRPTSRLLQLQLVLVLSTAAEQQLHQRRQANGGGSLVGPSAMARRPGGRGPEDRSQFDIGEPPFGFVSMGPRSWR